MATDRYANGFVFVDQQLLCEELDVDLEYDPALKEVATQVKGFAGVTKGAGKTTAKVSSAILRSGLELDVYALAQGATPAELVVAAGGKKRVSKGFITNVTEKFGVNQEARLDFSFVGEELKLVS